jgi:ABC-type amino acid transport substrate-binding protein
MDLTLAFLVRDADRGEFRTLRNVLRQETFRVGVVQHGQAFRALLAHHFPNAQTVPIESPRAFLRGKRNDLDAVVYSAEGGSAWTLIYPDFTVALPTPLSLKIPMGYPIAKGESAFRVFLSEWIRLKQKDGTVDALFEHWILGGGAKPKTHRWSVIRDVLGWVE